MEKFQITDQEKISRFLLFYILDKALGTSPLEIILNITQKINKTYLQNFSTTIILLDTIVFRHLLCSIQLESPWRR